MQKQTIILLNLSTKSRDSTITRGDCIKKNVQYQGKLKISDKYNPSLGTLRWKYQIMEKATVEYSIDLEKCQDIQISKLVVNQ